MWRSHSGRLTASHVPSGAKNRGAVTPDANKENTPNQLAGACCGMALSSTIRGGGRPRSWSSACKCRYPVTPPFTSRSWAPPHGFVISWPPRPPSPHLPPCCNFTLESARARWVSHAANLWPDLRPRPKWRFEASHLLRKNVDFQ